MPNRIMSAAVSAALAVVAFGCGTDTPSPAEPSSAASAAASAPLDFEQVSAGAFHSCGVATDGKAWCWGSNDKGQLGTGTVTPSAGSMVPIAVAGGLLFRHVSAGYEHTCGLTTGGRVYCWGFNYWGQLGDGTMGEDHDRRGTPAVVAGGRRFRLVRAGWSHTCAITTSADAYCWGENLYGQAGDGGTALGRPAPVAVLGGLKWRQLAGGAEHTCGVSKTDKLYCWGLNDHGQLGDGTKKNRLTPVVVAGARTYRQVDAGTYTTCAVTTGDVAFCWGYNAQGEIGDGTTTSRLKPRAVAGHYEFDHVNVGGIHACGITTAGVGLCWGEGGSGALGYGATSGRTSPVEIVGGLVFRQINAGVAHTCAVTTSDKAYCWGANGRLGDGANVMRVVPSPVAGP